MTRMQLATETTPQRFSIEEAIAGRRSRRAFSGKAMALADLSRLLHYTCGLTDNRNRFRAAPSAGATYPIEAHTVVNNVEGLAPGAYRYLIATHELETLRLGDLSRKIVQAALGQRFLGNANVVLALSAVFQRTTQQYGERGYRYVYFEAGHVAQNACLVATAMGLGSCAVGAFHDRHVNRMLELDGDKESALYLIAVGRI